MRFWLSFARCPAWPAETQPKGWFTLRMKKLDFVTRHRNGPKLDFSREIRHMKRLATMTIGFTALLLPAAAFAGSTIVNGYGGKAGTSVNNVLGATKVHHSGNLPFTGVNLALFAAAGVLMIGLGILLSRAARRNRHEI
jgi:hypothetical protein